MKRLQVQSAAALVAGDPLDDSPPTAEETAAYDKLCAEFFAEPKRERPRFEPIPPDEFADAVPESWLIKDVLPQAELVVIYGESGSGKSFLALDMAAALTRGIDWNGHAVERARSVTYIAAEASRGFKKRMRAYAKKNDVALSVLPWVIPDCPYFLKADDPIAIGKGLIDTGQRDVLIIDTLSAVAAGGNENSGEDMGMVMQYCKQLHKHTGALVVLIHHSGKDAAKGARGWSGLRAGADAEIEVSRDGRTDKRQFTVTKQKDSEDGTVTQFKLERVPLGGDESSCVISFDIPQARASAPGAQPSGDYEKAVMQHFGASFEARTTESISNALLDKLPKPKAGKRDQRDVSIINAITRLCQKGILETVPGTDGESVRKRGAVESDIDPFEIPKGNA